MGRALRADELLDLLGRHSLLTTEQLAALLAVTPSRARHLRQLLVRQGLARMIPVDEIAARSSNAWVENLAAIDELAELTPAGRRRLARRLGLPVAAAGRHNGLFGGSPQHRGQALRHLAHTIGANEVLVRLALATRMATARGTDEALEEWRPAAACERSRCKPDGYGCIRRGDARVGFLLEYDRGTERASQYDTKLSTYYAYRQSGRADRDYSDFPTLLFVTTDPGAENRILAAAVRA